MSDQKKYPSDKFTFAKVMWGIIRRHPDYIEFCNANEFDNNGFCIENESNKDQIESIKKRFRIINVLNPSLNLDGEDGEWRLTNIFTTATRAVTRVSDKRNDFSETHIRVDIDVRAPWTVIKKEIQEWIELRELSRKAAVDTLRLPEDTLKERYPFLRYNPESYFSAFDVWDLHVEGNRPSEIARTLWPEECEASFQIIEKKYQELSKKYRERGDDDFDIKAYNETYGDTEDDDDLGKVGTYVKRTEDKVKRMKELLQIFDTHRDYN
jgi:flagellin-specific chaperone FliS